MRAWGTLIATALLLCACVGVPPPSLADDPPARGRATAERACAGCHALTPGQNSADPKAPPFPGREMQHTAGLAGRVAQLTRHGHYGMPPIPLTADEAADVTAYIESLDARRRGSRSP